MFETSKIIEIMKLVIGNPIMLFNKLICAVTLVISTLFYKLLAIF